MSTQDRPFFRRIDIRYPWLKLVVVLLVGVFMILDLLDLTVSKAQDPHNKIKVAPMAKHVRVTSRDLSGKKIVALTFDDGPSSITTPKLLDILLEKEAVATFFMLGKGARNNPELVKRVKNEGNEVASHTMYHQNMRRIAADAAATDIEESKGVFREILGNDIKYTRPPYGNVTDVVKNSVGTPIMLWSVDALDWKNRDAEMILQTVRNRVFDGAIVLMHDIYETSVAATGLIIDALREDGYEFVTITEMARERGIEPETGVVYYGF